MPNGNPGKVTAVSGGHWQKEHLSAPGALVSKLPLPPPAPRPWCVGCDEPRPRDTTPKGPAEISKGVRAGGQGRGVGRQVTPNAGPVSSGAEQGRSWAGRRGNRTGWFHIYTNVTSLHCSAHS